MNNSAAPEEKGPLTEEERIAQVNADRRGAQQWVMLSWADWRESRHDLAAFWNTAVRQAINDGLADLSDPRVLDRVGEGEPGPMRIYITIENAGWSIRHRAAAADFLFTLAERLGVPSYQREPFLAGPSHAALRDAWPA